MFVGSTAADLKIGSNRVKAVRQGANLRYFRPDSISGLEAWWDAADASTVTLDGSDVVSVADKSGNSNTLAPPSAGVRPAYSASALNGKGGMVLTNGTDYLTAAVSGLSSLAGLTVFSVFKTSVAATADANTGVFWSYGNFGNAGSGYPARSGFSFGSGTGVLSGETMVLNVEAGSDGRLGSSSYGRDADAGTIDAVSVGASGTNLRQNGIAVPLNLTSIVTTAGDHSPSQIGYAVDDDIHVGALRLSGVITPLPITGTTTVCEQLVFSSQLSEADRQLVEGYLAHKWGLQSKLPYDHPYASSFYGVQSIPTDTDVLSFAAASGAVSIPDLLKIEDLVAYLKAESLWDYARFYPMKSAQNAGSGSTVYGLGGLTSNNMTLVNSPTWGSDGVTFDGSTQYGTAETSDLSSHGEILLLLRASPTNASSPDVNAHIRCGIGNIQSTSPAATLTGYTFGFTTASTSGETVSSFITAEGDASISKIIGSSGVTWTAGEDHIVGYQFGDAAVFYKNKDGYTPDKNSGATPSTPLGPSDIGGDVSDFFVAGQQVNGSPTAAQSPGVVSMYFVIAGETALTTTQRETITDFINAL